MNPGKVLVLENWSALHIPVWGERRHVSDASCFFSWGAYCGENQVLHHHHLLLLLILPLSLFFGVDMNNGALCSSLWEAISSPHQMPIWGILHLVYMQAGVWVVRSMCRLILYPKSGHHHHHHHNSNHNITTNITQKLPGLKEYFQVSAKTRVLWTKKTKKNTHTQ